MDIAIRTSADMTRLVVDLFKVSEDFGKVYAAARIEELEARVAGLEAQAAARQQALAAVADWLMTLYPPNEARERLLAQVRAAIAENGGERIELERELALAVQAVIDRVQSARAAGGDLHLRIGIGLQAQLNAARNRARDAGVL